jgi:Putative zinc-finger
MQHLDEGTIHSWLDGALSADEAARVQAHVAECPQCAAAVAEARGFIAASSRILTALDHVPRGVVPAVSPVKWYNRAAWRAAAAVLVVAVGSLVVVRNTDRKSAGSPKMIDSVGANRDTVQIVYDSVVAKQDTVQIVRASPAATRGRKPQVPASVKPSVQNAPSFGVASSGKPSAEADFSAKSVRGASPQSNVVPRERALNEGVDALIGGNAAAAPQVAGAVAAAPQSALSPRVSGVTVMGAVASEQPPLKVVGRPRVLGAKVTLYEVAPGDTVTFTEALSIQLNEVVTTGISSAELQARRSMEKSAAAAPTRAPTPSPTVPPLQVEAVNGVTTISWPDAATGNMLKLSGRMSVERLKEIMSRIERERAAAAKKSP